MTGSKWKPYDLARLIDIKHGFAFQGDSFRNNPPGDILLTPGNFKIGGGFKDDKLKYYIGSVPDEYFLQEGDLLITMTDLSKEADILGYPAFVPSVGNQRFLHNQRLGKVLIRKSAPLDRKFLYYLLCTQEYRNEIIASATGTTVKHTSPSRIMAFKFLLPPEPEQLAIAHILGTLDDKIELNRKMNETLGAMARALFKSWFVDFDPVRAKAESRDPGLPKEIADLFPDSFEESELGEIPKGWRYCPFTDAVEVIGGGTPKTSIAEYWNGSIPWFSVVDAPNNIDVFAIDTEKKITNAGIENSSTQILPKGTTIVTARGTVGKVALVGVPMAMNQSCYGLKGKVGKQGFFTYFTARALLSTLKQQTHGSVFDTITRDTLSNINAIMPPSPIVEKFEYVIQPTLYRILNNLFESLALTVIRDALLPKLLSGEIRVKDAERFVEARV